MSTDSDLHQRRVSFIACESIKEEGFLFANPTADYIDAGKLSGPLDSFTSVSGSNLKMTVVKGVYSAQDQNDLVVPWTLACLHTMAIFPS